MIRVEDEGFRDCCGKQVLVIPGGGRGRGTLRLKGEGRLSQFGELRQIFMPYALAKAHVTELPLAAHIDQTGVGKLFKVVGAGGRRDAEPVAGLTTAQLSFAGDALQDTVALSVRDGLADAAELLRGH